MRTRIATLLLSGLIAASARFDDEVAALKEAGVQAYNFFAEAGAGLAEAAYEKLENHLKEKNAGEKNEK